MINSEFSASEVVSSLSAITGACRIVSQTIAFVDLAKLAPNFQLTAKSPSRLKRNRPSYRPYCQPAK